MAGRFAGAVREPSAVPGVGDRLDVRDDAAASAVARALGEELRRAREARGLSRVQFVELLSSGIGDRTLLAYEHGVRHVTVLRLVELAETLGVPASVIVGQALQRARITVGNLVVRVDLRRLLRDEAIAYRPLVPWARNRLNDSDDGVVEVTPTGVRELAAFLGRPALDVVSYLTQFTPERFPAGAEVESVPV